MINHLPDDKPKEGEMSYKKKIDLYGDGIGFVEYVQHMGDDLTIVNAARVSFGKEKKELDDRDKKLINYLIEHNHTSTLEHNIVTFKVKVPLFVRSQHHRHRTFSYNEISRRYTDINIEFYEPSSFRTQHKSNRQASNADELINPEIGPAHQSFFASELVKDHHRSSLELFDKLIESGICREQARGVLPQNLYTTYIATVNLNNLIKFTNLRLHEGAQYEIQQVAKAFLDIAYDIWPNVMRAYDAVSK